MDVPREQLWEDFDSGEVHIRDKWQFALNSEFFPRPDFPLNQCIQEFYLFIPNSLQINSETYSKEQFYSDQTNLIRYKTPEFSFADLLNLQDIHSPIAHILSLCSEIETETKREQLSYELKLLANVVRSTLKKEIRALLFILETNQLSENLEFTTRIQILCANIRKIHENYSFAQQKYLNNWSDPQFYRQFLYVEEFISDAIFHYIAVLLENIKFSPFKNFTAVENELFELLTEEKKLAEAFSLKDNSKAYKTHKNTTKLSKIGLMEGETITYRASLLNKFILDALQLTTNRFSLNERYQHWIGGISAGVAMLLYFSLFVWLGSVFVINSEPFVILMVIVYVLKDRIKEWLRIASYQHATRWFPDFTTIIKSLDEKDKLGSLKESFSFINQDQLTPMLKQMRNDEFHTVLETFQRPESIVYYKRVVEINSSHFNKNRRLGLNLIFRFNIQRFLYKASDPVESHLMIDPVPRKLFRLRLPKVYHLNLILKTSFISKDKTKKSEFTKLRIIIDRNGIKRIEQLS